MTGIGADEDQGAADAWARVEAGLIRVLPASLRRLATPAGKREIDAVEAALGVVLPPDFRASLGIHNGTRLDLRWDWPSPVPLESLYDTGEIVEWTRDWRSNAMSEDEIGNDWAINGPVRPMVGSTSHVLVGTMNGDVHWLLDLSPAPGGTLGQVVRVDVECGLWDVLAPSWTRLLVRYAKDLERYAATPDSSPLMIDQNYGPECEWGRPGRPS
jgi:cell wall assembly regulator SMI1